MGGQEKHVLRGKDFLYPIIDISYGKLLFDLLSKSDGNAVAMEDVTTDEKMTYGEVLRESCKLAESLRNAGYGQKTVIMINSENSIRVFPVIAAAAFIGAKISFINPLYEEAEISHVLNIVKPNIIFCSEYSFDSMVPFKKKNKYVNHVFLMGDKKLDEFLKDNCGTLKEDQFYVNDTDLNDPVFLLCSSGTTGLPKCVMISHKAMYCRYIEALDPDYILPKEPYILGLIPFFHIYGLYIMTTALMHSKVLLIMNRFDPDILLKTIQDYKLLNIYTVPPLMIYLAKSPTVDDYDLSSLQTVFCGGAALKNSTEELVKKRLNLNHVIQGYGMTETSLSVLLGLENKKRLIAGVFGKVVDPKTGKTLGPNEVGELCFKGPYVTYGYYNNIKETKNTIREGWIYTGDLGYFDEEENFFIVDRLKELIKYNGYQVSPAELESILLSHSSVSDAGVVGLPNEMAGELPLAFVVKVEEAKVTEKEIEQFVANKISPQKRLRGGVVFVDNIPRNAAGKILRRELKEFINNLPSKL